MKTSPESKKEDVKGHQGQRPQHQNQNQNEAHGYGVPQARINTQKLIFPKLQVGSANDPAEREADLAAEQVMRGGKVHTEGARSVTTGSGIDQPGALRMKANSAATGGMAAPPSVESKINSKRGKGGTLPQPIQQKLSHTFGTDFSGVRVHNDSSSHEMNAQLRAKAFAQGSDMFFGHGQYAPGTAEGDRLIAHEAAHVVQQNHLSENRSGIIRKKDGHHPFVYQGNSKYVVGTMGQDNTYIDFLSYLSSNKSHTPGLNNKGYNRVLKPSDQGSNVIHADELRHHGSSGFVSFNTNYKLFLDTKEVSWSGGPEVKNTITSVASYRTTDKIHFDNIITASVQQVYEDLFIVTDIQEMDGDRFVVRVRLHRQPENIKQGSVELSKSSSGFKAGLEANGKADYSTKLSLHLEADGSDIVTLLSGGKSFKVPLSKVKASKSITDKLTSLGLMDEFLKKQLVTIDSSHSFLASVFGEIGMRYEHSSFEAAYKYKAQDFTTKEIVAEELYTIFFKGNISNPSAYVHYKEDVSESIEELSKESYNSWIQSHLDEIAQMKHPGSELEIVIYGSASLKGNSTPEGKNHNIELAEKRAQTMYNKLRIEQGIYRDNISYIGQGVPKGAKVSEIADQNAFILIRQKRK